MFAKITNNELPHPPLDHNKIINNIVITQHNVIKNKQFKTGIIISVLKFVDNTKYCMFKIIMPNKKKINSNDFIFLKILQEDFSHLVSVNVMKSFHYHQIYHHSIFQ